jgi:hypothetical protein
VENARLLDERLKRIIGEVGYRTSGEIKKNLLQDMEKSFLSMLEAHYRRETIRLLSLFSDVVKKI